MRLASRGVFVRRESSSVCDEILVRVGGNEIHCETVRDLERALGQPVFSVFPSENLDVCLCCVDIKATAHGSSLQVRPTTDSDEGYPFVAWVFYDAVKLERAE